MTRFFKSKELACPCCGSCLVDKEALERLDKARFIAGLPFIINSAYRCRKHNEEVGGKNTSEHLSGKAFDIKCTDSRTRLIIIDALLKAGFDRIGIAKTYIHADTSNVKDRNVMWLY